MLTLDKALVAAKGRDEFAIKEHDGVVVFNYVYQLPDSFEGIRREFRGITFNGKTGALVSLPLHKFFNINQTEDTLFYKIKHLSATVYGKEDGTLVHFYKYKNELRAATRMSCNTDHAKAAYCLAVELKLIDAINLEIVAGRTPIFEFCSPKNRIVVQYDKPRLIYLHSRCRFTGRYSRSLDRFADHARQFEIDFSEIIDTVSGLTNFEGFVCTLSNGEWVKAKSDWYRERHHVVDYLMKPKYFLYDLVYRGVMDDLIAVTEDKERKDTLKEIYKEAQLDLIAEKRRVQNLFEKAKKETEAQELETKEEKFLVISDLPAVKKSEFLRALKTAGLSCSEIVRMVSGLKAGKSQEVRLLPNSDLDSLSALGCVFEIKTRLVTEKDCHRKKFAIHVNKNYPADLAPLMCLYEDTEIDNILASTLVSAYKTRYPDSLLSGKFV